MKKLSFVKVLLRKPSYNDTYIKARAGSWRKKMATTLEKPKLTKDKGMSKDLDNLLAGIDLKTDTTTTKTQIKPAHTSEGTESKKEATDRQQSESEPDFDALSKNFEELQSSQPIAQTEQKQAELSEDEMNDIFARFDALNNPSKTPDNQPPEVQTPFPSVQQPTLTETQQQNWDDFTKQIEDAVKEQENLPLLQQMLEKKRNLAELEQDPNFDKEQLEPIRQEIEYFENELKSEHDELLNLNTLLSSTIIHPTAEKSLEQVAQSLNSSLPPKKIKLLQAEFENRRIQLEKINNKFKTLTKSIEKKLGTKIEDVQTQEFTKIWLAVGFAQYVAKQLKEQNEIAQKSEKLFDFTNRFASYQQNLTTINQQLSEINNQNSLEKQEHLLQKLKENIQIDEELEGFELLNMQSSTDSLSLQVSHIETIQNKSEAIEKHLSEIRNYYQQSLANLKKEFKTVKENLNDKQKQDYPQQLETHRQLVGTLYETIQKISKKIENSIETEVNHLEILANNLLNHATVEDFVLDLEANAFLNDENQSPSGATHPNIQAIKETKELLEKTKEKIKNNSELDERIAGIEKQLTLAEDLSAALAEIAPIYQEAQEEIKRLQIEAKKVQDLKLPEDKAVSINQIRDNLEFISFKKQAIDAALEPIYQKANQIQKEIATVEKNYKDKNYSILTQFKNINETIITDINETKLIENLNDHFEKEKGQFISKLKLTIGNYHDRAFQLANTTQQDQAGQKKFPITELNRNIRKMQDLIDSTQALSKTEKQDLSNKLIEAKNLLPTFSKNQEDIVNKLIANTNDIYDIDKPKSIGDEEAALANDEYIRNFGSKAQIDRYHKTLIANGIIEKRQEQALALYKEGHTLSQSEFQIVLLNYQFIKNNAPKKLDEFKQQLRQKGGDINKLDLLTTTDVTKLSNDLFMTFYNRTTQHIIADKQKPQGLGLAGFNLPGSAGLIPPIIDLAVQAKRAHSQSKQDGAKANESSNSFVRGLKNIITPILNPMKNFFNQPGVKRAFGVATTVEQKSQLYILPPYAKKQSEEHEMASIIDMLVDDKPNIESKRGKLIHRLAGQSKDAAQAGLTREWKKDANKIKNKIDDKQAQLEEAKNQVLFVGAGEKFDEQIKKINGLKNELNELKIIQSMMARRFKELSETQRKNSKNTFVDASCNPFAELAEKTEIKEGNLEKIKVEASTCNPTPNDYYDFKEEMSKAMNYISQFLTQKLTLEQAENELNQIKKDSKIPDMLYSQNIKIDFNNKQYSPIDLLKEYNQTKVEVKNLIKEKFVQQTEESMSNRIAAANA